MQKTMECNKQASIPVVPLEREGKVKNSGALPACNKKNIIGAEGLMGGFNVSFLVEVKLLGDEHLMLNIS